MEWSASFSLASASDPLEVRRRMPAVSLEGLFEGLHMLPDEQTIDLLARAHELLARQAKS